MNYKLLIIFLISCVLQASSLDAVNVCSDDKNKNKTTRPIALKEISISGGLKSIFIPYNIDGTSNKYVIVINASHAVNVISKDGNGILYWDAQRESYSYCSSYSVTHIYEIR